ncbi:MAG: ABC transporter ATP-binding protein [Candidatus Gastranaerophilales bacterium]|nr:ABC transporter ATP-binding protein [Candidatus Gastranaerophilales bacterium]
MKNILEIKDLNISFKLESQIAKAIHGISLQLERAKSLGIVGESGCGKSVTAMSVMRLLPSNAVIESGEILWKEKNILGFSEKEMQQIRGNQIALIPQDPMTSLNPLYTVGEQIHEVIALHQKVSKKEAKEIAIESLKNVKIPEADKRYNDYPHQFSGGMRQRAIIAMSLSCNPELIIADEPTTALDVTVQAQILNLIKSVQEERGTSLLLITHDLGIVAETCNNVAVLYAGRIVEYADVMSIFKNPLHPYTQGLLESLPVKNSQKLKAIKGQPPAISDNISGCPFYPRCGHRIELCKNVSPELITVSENHRVSCHLYN